MNLAENLTLPTSLYRIWHELLFGSYATADLRNFDMTITRRELGLGLAASGITIRAPRLTTENSPSESFPSQGKWKEIYAGVWRMTLGAPEDFTPVSHRFVPPNHTLLREIQGPLESPQLQITGVAGRRGYRVELPLHPNEEIFGLGLQMLGFARRGRKLTLRVNADPKIDSGDSHAPVPFYVSTLGYGILVDTARYATFYFGNAAPKPQQSVSTVSAQSDPNPKYLRSQGREQPGQVTIDIPSARGVDLYYFAGPDMLTAVRRYNAFSGGGFIPPEWGLGFWYRVGSQCTQVEAMDLARSFRERKIPCDVLGLEAGWHSHAYSCTFSWNEDRFADPAGFLSSAEKLQFKVNLWEHPFTHPASPVFPQLQQHSGEFGVWGGLVPDFASHTARTIFGNYHGETFIDKGVGGFKLDECDNSDYTGGWSFPECSKFPSGVDGEQMHSVFGLRYQQAIWEQFQKRDKATYGLVRSSGTLAAPYPFVLYSDLYRHRDFMRALVNSGFSGLLWCPEVRDAESEEDLIRRLQSVVFSPLAMVNGWYIKNPPWIQLNRAKNNAGELLEHWEKLEARCREIIGWRMQLIPYLTAAFAKYAEDGTPPFRALIMDYPEDFRFLSVDDQYLIGDRMLVAPLFAGEPGRKVIFPSGTWHDFWSGEKVQDNEISLSSSFAQIPVFVKSGSIIALADVGPHAGSKESSQLSAKIYGDGSLPATLVDGRNRGRLEWARGKGNVLGDSTRYRITSWERAGQ